MAVKGSWAYEKEMVFLGFFGWFLEKKGRLFPLLGKGGGGGAGSLREKRGAPPSAPTRFFKDQFCRKGK